MKERIHKLVHEKNNNSLFKINNKNYFGLNLMGWRTVSSTTKVFPFSVWFTWLIINDDSSI